MSKKPKIRTWIKILIGLTLGILFGVIVGQKYPSIEFLGKVFIDLLKMLVGILIFSSIVSGVCHIHDPKKLGRIGIRTLIFYTVTTIIAISFGIVLAYMIRPGLGLSLAYNPGGVQPHKILNFYDFFASIIPANPFAAFAEGNILQVIIFAVFFGYAIMLAGDKGKPILRVFESTSEVMNELTHFVMRFAPIGIFALIATAVADIGLKVILPLSLFLLCTYMGCFLQVFLVFPLILRFLAKVRIAPFFKGMKDAIILAFSTSSSAATLPVTMECVRDKLGVSEDISGFVLSLGATINMNGAAIGQAVSAIFISQAYGIELNLLQILVLVMVSLFSAIGAAGIPGTGIVMLSVVLNAVGLPIEGIALVAGVDRIREMVSTIVNILGDAVAALYVARKEGRVNVKAYSHAAWLD